MRTKVMSILTAFTIVTMAFTAPPVNAVESKTIDNSMTISYTYENGIVDAVLTATGSVCIGGFEASIDYNEDDYSVKGKSSSNSNILINDVPAKGEVVISMAANENLTEESELFTISFNSTSKPNKSDFSFDISDMYMFNENLDADSVSYTISEKWYGFEDSSSTTPQSTTSIQSTTTTATTTAITTNPSDEKSDNKFVVSVQENKDSNAVEVSLSVQGKVEFWTAEGVIKLNMSGLDTPTQLTAISDALTSFKDDTNNIYFTIVSSSGQNITEEQTLFTYSIPIKTSDYSISCEPKIVDICNADYKDVPCSITVIGEQEQTATTSTSSTTTISQTTTTTSSSETTTTKQSSTTVSDTSKETTTSSNTTSDTSANTTSTEQSSTTTSSTTEIVTTTEEAKVNVSPYEMSNWAENDYFKKTGVEPYASTYTENDDGTLTITLLDEEGNVLDKYTVHSKTGIGFNSSGEEVNLPQTGNNSMKNWLILFGALMLIGLGAVSIKASRVSIRRKDER